MWQIWIFISSTELWKMWKIDTRTKYILLTNEFHQLVAFAKLFLFDGSPGASVAHSSYSKIVLRLRDITMATITSVFSCTVCIHVSSLWSSPKDERVPSFSPLSLLCACHADLSGSIIFLVDRKQCGVKKDCVTVGFTICVSNRRENESYEQPRVSVVA